MARQTSSMSFYSNGDESDDGYEPNIGNLQPLREQVEKMKGLV